ncbi:MAG: ATP-binding protein [Lachnospira sp.]
MGRHSIKFKITLLLVGTIAALIALLLIFNIAFSEKFYLEDKHKSMLDSYDSINSTCSDYENGNINEEELNTNLEQIATSNAISVIIVNSDWTTYYVSTQGDEMMLERLKMSIFNSDIFKQNIYDGSFYDKSKRKENEENADNPGETKEKPNDRNDGMGSKDNGGAENSDLFGEKSIIDMSGNGATESRSIIKKTDKYTLQKVYDSRLLDDYLELWGTLDNGKSILIRTPIQGIKDNVHISNRLITYVGGATILLGIVAAVILSTYISRPIKQLSSIAERMSEMDFEAKYQGSDKGEIGLLGTSMNNMSRKLEENISRLKAANLELQRDIDKRDKQEQMRTDFLSNVSHELKTPIALIQGYAEGLKEGITDDPESMDFYCDVIIDEANKMNNMVKRLLTLNQIEFGNDELIMERFDIKELVKSVVNANELRASQKGISITYHTDDKPLYVWADEYKVEEVITNYISNAINHCSRENIIEVRVGKIDEDNVRVSVFNTGDNIPSEDIEHIWEKFYKVDKARTREYGGNGIGLSIVKAIMDSMGKSCGVENLENGVVFWFDLDCKL